MKSSIKNKIVVLSGKGGVGKSTVSANIAMTLALNGYKTGLLDIDLHGPSIPTMLGLEQNRAEGTEQLIFPCAYGDDLLKVISVGFLINNPDDAVIWRGPAKTGVIKQFIENVVWEELDYLVVDCPPGTGDEPLSAVQLLENVTGAIIVTTPQKLAICDVRKSVNFCEKVNIPVLGVIENMSGFVCPDCNKKIDIFKTGGGKEMAEEMKVPFLGKIPLDPYIVEAGDSGKPFVYHYSETPTAKIMEGIIDQLITAEKNKMQPDKTKENTNVIRFAVPTHNGELCLHFGHCEVFKIIDLDEKTGEIISTQEKVPPPHEPGVLPRWLAENNVSVIAAGGMGSRARALFEEFNIKVIVGAEEKNPEKLVLSYIDGTLKTGVNACDH